ncbi:hypothetical protein I8H89_00660 [Candidatus Saccharibacteria bacterium]|nr:hypothetical protein [Candidatus Saccharibacteria bacterium]
MKKFLIIAVTLSIIATCAGAFAYFKYFSPESRAKYVSENYMKSLLANDTEKASTLFPLKPATSEILQRNYRLSTIAMENDLYYVLYNFADSKQPSLIRFTIESSEIKKIETGSRLGLTPSTDKLEAEQQTAGVSKCLTKSDLKYIDSTSVYARNIRGATMIFPSDSTEYIATDDSNSLLDRMANFYKKAYENDFIFELRGYRQSTGLSGKESEQLDSLFQRRAIVLQKELIKRGVPLDRILISDKYTYYIPEQSTEVTNELYVDINVVNRCIKV